LLLSDHFISLKDNEDDFEEVDDFEDLEDDFEIDPVKKRTKASGKSMKISQKRDSGLMFASAEEFASIIDENEGDLDEGKLDRVKMQLKLGFVTRFFLILFLNFRFSIRTRVLRNNLLGRKNVTQTPRGHFPKR